MFYGDLPQLCLGNQLRKPRWVSSGAGTDLKVHAFLRLRMSEHANRFLAEGLPFCPNIRMRPLAGMDVASSRCRKPTVALI